ncbi:MAG: RtcB family protein [Candidatus Omnitrophota bacterium]
MWQGELEKINDYKFRIPRSYKPGMRVDGIIYANEKLLVDIKRDKAPEQVANVAFLPGIVKYSLAMPDIHWGYGFCLTRDAKILTNFGFYKTICDFEKDWSTCYLKSMDLNSQKPTETPILKFIKLKPKTLFKVTTKTGYEIKATGDHPFLTPFGMKPIQQLTAQDKVALFPFRGIQYEHASTKTIITEKDVKKTLLRLARRPNTPKFEIILEKIRMRKLIPLTYDHPSLPYILKIMGFIFGDGSMNFIGKKGDGIIHFSGKPEDLENVRKDIEKIGYTPSPIHYQKSKLAITGKNYDSYSFVVNASSLVVLLETLGVPRGTKVTQSYRVPEWILKSPLWQKRLFLASLFGCELRMPHRRLGRRGYFNAPVFPMAKSEELIKNGKEFLNDLERLLKEFGVRTIGINMRRRHISRRGIVTRSLELLISPSPENLFNLWGKIGFEYNLKRSFVSNVAVHYLKLKLRILKEKEEAVKITIPKLLKNGLSYQKIALQLAGNSLTKRFIIDICWKLNKGKVVVPRIPASFPFFENHLREIRKGLGDSGMLWDEIKTIESIPSQDFVYDFTVSHPDHNFIANNFVVSNCIGGVAATDPQDGGVISPGGVGYDINCGVRLLRTNLSVEDLKTKVNKIVDTLYNDIPSGVGSTGEIKVSHQEERKLLLEGARWAVLRGLGVKDDLEYCEEYGAIEGADPDSVSRRAYERGKEQAGTLGSGNHFIEVQVIEDIYDKDVAQVLGLDIGQVTVMIHSGSRGLGYQVCDDYAREMIGCLSKYSINVPDPQLACAPVNSPEAKNYIGAMRAAANYAWANRQVLMHLTRESFGRVFSKSWQSLGMDLIYDVAHNIAKFEKHIVDGKEKMLCIHRKGATRAFGPQHPELPARYKAIGQPVIIPGDMGRASYLLVGTKKAEEETFASTCHGAGRVASRHQALKTIDLNDLLHELKAKGIEVRATSKKTIVEEAPAVYKNVDDVVEIVHKTGLAKKVCRMRPVCVVKG